MQCAKIHTYYAEKSVHESVQHGRIDKGSTKMYGNRKHIKSCNKNDKPQGKLPKSAIKKNHQ